MRAPHSWIPAALAAVMLSACASAPAHKAATNSRTVILSEEIAKAGFIDAYSTVQSLRPQWLVARGTTSINSPETIKVYLDGSLLGTPETLRQIATNSIASIRYMDSMEASNRYGLDHGLGAILVYSKQ